MVYLIAFFQCISYIYILCLQNFQTEDDPKGTSGSLVNSWQMESAVPDISVEIIPKNTPNNDATKVF